MFQSHSSLPEKMLLLLQLLLLLLLDYLKKILYFQIHTKLFLHITKCPHSKFFSLFPIVTLCFLLWLGVGAWYFITVFELLLRWHIERVINENNWTLIVRIASVFSFSRTERVSSCSDTIRGNFEKMGFCYMGSPMSRKLSLLFSLGVMLT